MVLCCEEFNMQAQTTQKHQGGSSVSFTLNIFSKTSTVFLKAGLVCGYCTPSKNAQSSSPSQCGGFLGFLATTAGHSCITQDNSTFVQMLIFPLVILFFYVNDKTNTNAFDKYTKPGVCNQRVTCGYLNSPWVALW